MKATPTCRDDKRHAVDRGAAGLRFQKDRSPVLVTEMCEVCQTIALRVVDAATWRNSQKAQNGFACHLIYPPPVMRKARLQQICEVCRSPAWLDKYSIARFAFSVQQADPVWRSLDTDQLCAAIRAFAQPLVCAGNARRKYLISKVPLADEGDYVVMLKTHRKDA